MPDKEQVLPVTHEAIERPKCAACNGTGWSGGSQPTDKRGEPIGDLGDACEECCGDGKARTPPDVVEREASGGVAIPAGMVPWHSADWGPNDYGTGEVLTRGGGRMSMVPMNDLRWKHATGDGCSEDIIAYTPRTLPTCEVCDTPDLCQSGQCPCTLSSEFIAPVPANVANKLLALSRTLPTKQQGEAIPALVERLRDEVIEAARDLVMRPGGLRNNGEHLIVVEKRDKSDAHYRLCAAFEALYAVLAQPQAEAAVPEGMVPWHGGWSVPDDWDGTEMLMRNGKMRKASRLPLAWRWSTDPDRLCDRELDIIAYTPLPEAGKGYTVVARPQSAEGGEARLEAVRRAIALVETPDAPKSATDPWDWNYWPPKSRERFDQLARAATPVVERGGQADDTRAQKVFLDKLAGHAVDLRREEWDEDNEAATLVEQAVSRLSAPVPETHVLVSREANGWRTMESAPDEPPVLLWPDQFGNCVIGDKRANDGTWWTGDWDYQIPATLWQPLPDAPAADAILALLDGDGR